jgi:hypothetical protein
MSRKTRDNDNYSKLHDFTKVWWGDEVLPKILAEGWDEEGRIGGDSESLNYFHLWSGGLEAN